MNFNRRRESVAFLLGAGFCADAVLEVRPFTNTEAHYPLVTDLSSKCFRISELPSGKSIEELFQESITKRDPAPREELYDMIMEADYYLTPDLLPKENRQDNVYLRMLQDFSSASILTFNYDSLVEILLLNLGQWRPDDGYGVPVHTELPISTGTHAKLPEFSSRLVLHLHGTLCVYPNISIENASHRGNYPTLNPKSGFIFDPDAITCCFPPFKRPPASLGFHYPYERVLAPIPNKTEGLQNRFIKSIYERAVDIIRSTQTIVAIGYSFNPHDRDSYSQLLEAAHGAKIILVVPEAHKLSARLRAEHPKIEWHAISKTFREWVIQDYEGIRGIGK